MIVTFSIFHNIRKNLPIFCSFTNNFTNTFQKPFSYKATKQLLNKFKSRYPLVKIPARFYRILLNRNFSLRVSEYVPFTNSLSLTIPKNQIVNTNNETLTNTKFANKQLIEDVIQRNKEIFKQTEYKLRRRGNIFIQDMKATKKRMKERMGGVIERENIYTIPNFLCVSRIAMTPYLGMLIIQSNFNWALAVLSLAALTDLLDGWIARTWRSQSSKVGSFLDPMADKILISTLFLTLTYNNLIPVALTAMIITRDTLLIIAGFVIRYNSLPPPRTLSRYFDASHATAQLAPTFISKVNTVVQLILVGSTLAAPVFHYVDHPVMQCLWYITGATTIAAGISYIIMENTYKYLKK